MLDQTAGAPAARSHTQPPRDFQEHLAELEAQGLLVRVERPIDKDTELHPLVRWQFQGGLAEDRRRAFMFTHVVDGAGRKIDNLHRRGSDLSISWCIRKAHEGIAVRDVQIVSHERDPVW